MQRYDPQQAPLPPHAQLREVSERLKQPLHSRPAEERLKLATVATEQGTGGSTTAQWAIAAAVCAFLAATYAYYGTHGWLQPNLDLSSVEAARAARSVTSLHLYLVVGVPVTLLILLSFAAAIGTVRKWRVGDAQAWWMLVLYFAAPLNIFVFFYLLMKIQWLAAQWAVYGA